MLGHLRSNLISDDEEQKCTNGKNSKRNGKGKVEKTANEE